MAYLEEMEESQTIGDGTELAIIGMAGRFPGARNINQFWENLKGGIESISFFTDEEVLGTGVDPRLVRDPYYVKAGGVLDDVDQFDANFFGFYPQEAAILDPQHRVFLETSWEALENAGYNPEAFPGWIGVFAGTGMNTYLLYNLIANADVMENVHGYQLTISNDKDFLPTKVSYKLNLRGPSINIQTACSTSLVAVHLACQSLLNFQCDMALAGGVAIRFPQKQGYLYQEGGIGSPDGHCRAFDKDARGTVNGNGVGVVVIKRLEDAYRAGDNIMAVIKGSAINNDGSLKVGYTAPSVDGQSEVIATAQMLANVDPESITYIETHGTGTELGDPIEITALNKVFQANTSKTGYCAIGSVKTNVGHMDAAAGVTSVIKTVLALQKRQIPPSINFSSPNPRIDFQSSPFFVNTELRDWQTDGTPLRAGISSFGIGGTNAHVVVEEAPILPESGPSRDWNIVPLSAQTPDALDELTDNLVDHLGKNSSLNIADVAYTLSVGRKEFSAKRFIVARDLDDLVEGLGKRDAQRVFTELNSSNAQSQTRQVVFMFTGQGAQYVNMARELYLTEPVFQYQVDLCAEILKSRLGKDIRDLIYPELLDGTDDSEYEAAAAELTQTSMTQPALFVIEYALAILLNEYGVDPSAMIGHSIGEYVAACLSGVFSLEDALTLVTERGRLMQSLPGGSMISVPLSESRTRELLEQPGNNYATLSIASINAPELCVVSGDYDEINQFADVLDAGEIAYRRLHTSHAFHSPMMDPILDEFARRVKGMELAKPEIPFISNVTGTWITTEEATDPYYWVSHIRHTVRFSDGIRTLVQDPAWIFVEVGPGRTLTTLARNAMMGFDIDDEISSGHSHPVIQSVRHPNTETSDVAFLLTAIGRLWMAGAEIDWEAFYSGEFRRRLPLPTYPFQRQSYWIEPDHSLKDLFSARKRPQQQAIIKDPDVNNWFYLPSWKRADINPSRPVLDGAKSWLLLIDDSSNESLAGSIRDHLVDLGQMVTQVKIGESYQGNNGDHYIVNPLNPQDFEQLVEDLQSKDRIPDYIIHGLGLSDHYANNAQLSGYYSLLYFTQALATKSTTDQIHIGVLSKNAQDVIGNEHLNPYQAPLVGLCKVVSQEYQDYVCHSIDIPGDFLENDLSPARLDKLILELTAQSEDRIVAYRGDHRWIELYEPVGYPVAPEEAPKNLRSNGVYMITGGLGRIGLTFADYLAKKVGAKLVLVDRFEFPAGSVHSEWDRWLSQNDDTDPISLRVKKLKSIIKAGGEIQILQADVSDYDQMRDAVRKAEERYGEIHGLIHAAGIVGEGAIKPLVESGTEQSEAQFQPKISGTRILSEIFNDKKLDFVLLQSSLAAVLGGLGMAAYTAANIFMDSFAAVQNKNGNSPWISVNWDGWMFDDQADIERTRLELTMTPEEGIEIFERIMSSDFESRLIISTADMEPRVNRWIKLAPITVAAGDEASIDDRAEGRSPAGFRRPDLQTAYVPPRNALEESIVETWQKVLGITPIGIHDDFFELGGHSLLATQLVTRMRSTYDVQLPLRKLFESATVAGIAELIQDTRAGFPDRETPAGETFIAREVDIPFRSVPRDRELELSYGQQRLWFLDQMDPGSPLYNNFSAVKFSGEVNVEAFQYSLKKIIDRHEVLRTTFHEIGGRPIQKIHEDIVVPLTMIDLSDLTASEAESELNRLALKEARRPFNLAEGPMLRIALIRISNIEHVVFLTLHHIISDGWSVRVLIEEVGTYYSAFMNLRPEQLAEFSIPDLPVQYVDFAHWQREWLQAGVLTQQLDYWRKQLAEREGSTGNVELLPDYPRPPYQTTNGASIWFELPVDLSEKLVELSQKQGVTLFMVLMAALKTLLYRYTGQEDISVGTPIANRTRIETESLIGFILNTLVMRTDLSEDPSFENLLQREKEVSLDAYANQDVPFEMVVEALQPERDLSRTPFFQVIFDLQEAPLPALELEGLKISQLKIDNATSKFDLALSMEMHIKDQSDALLSGFFNFNTDLFNRTTVEGLINHWKNLLESIVSNPGKRLSEHVILSDDEFHTLVVDWSQRGKSRLLADFVHNQFDRQAYKTPGAIALTEVFGSYAYGQTLSYLELNQRANQLANYLVRLGIGPEKRVGVSVRRSIDMIVALLGILKAGGAFLPLDPTYPPGRLAYMMADADIDVLLTQERQLDNLPEKINGNKQITKLCLDRDWEKIAREPVDTPDCQIHAGNLAYIIYTSGSTGLPKGVMITHNDFVNHIHVIKNHFGITDSDRVLQFASLNFDAALEQVFTTLTTGANLYLRSEEIWPTDEFAQIVRELRLTVVNIPPVYWHHWSQYLVNKIQGPEEFEQVKREPLRLVIIGGDILQPETLKLWQKTSLRSTRLLNAYGPTETTITASTHEVKKPSYGGRDVVYHRVPIGQPPANRFVYILDQFGNPVPVRVPGELCIGGMGVARGYLNNPGLTAEKFVPNPYISYLPENGLPIEWKQKFYRTGDLVRYLPNGDIEFLGRIDHQIKLRGFRIELGEIETTLQMHPGVMECAVILSDGERSDQVDGESRKEKQLLAYIVPKGDQVPTITELFEYLRENLPNYMIPSAIITLDELPVSPSGKLNRSALPVPDALRPELEVAYVAPRTPVEMDLARLWTDVLGLEWENEQSPIGVHDNFFELGGHSLLATQIISRVRESYQIDLPIRRVFETPTIAGLSEIVYQGLIDSVETEEIEALLDEVDSMSDDEIQAFLADESPGAEVIDE